MASDSILSSGSSSTQQIRWVEQMSKTMQTETAIDIDIDLDLDLKDLLSIFQVPEKLTSEKPEAYKPQKLGLGPYHHFRPNLYKMQWQKLSAVKKFLNPDQIPDLQTLVIDKLKELEPAIRASYDSYLDLNCDTLSWIIAIDGLFLISYLEPQEQEEDEEEKVSVYRQDIMMLENQIPYFLLTQITKYLLPVPDENYHVAGDDVFFFENYRSFCEANSPLKPTEDDPVDDSFSHLLDLMYNLIVNNRGARESSKNRRHKRSAITYISEDFFKDSKKILEAAGQVMGLAGAPQIQSFFTFLQNLPCEEFLSLCSKNKKESEEDKSNAVEMEIPSASQLCKIGKCYCRK